MVYFRRPGKVHNQFFNHIFGCKCPPPMLRIEPAQYKQFRFYLYLWSRLCKTPCVIHRGPNLAAFSGKVPLTHHNRIFPEIPAKSRSCPIWFFFNLWFQIVSG